MDIKKKIETQDAIYTLIKDVVSRMYDKQRMTGLFLDLSLAFDTDNHRLLIEKLNLYGFRGKTEKNVCQN